ncbi:MAG: cation-translocating P-type ATPase [Verrucomicrobia bacterium]|nr:cation-translocating P-type ATPase [Verrucomicrobiota bacterium]
MTAGIPMKSTTTADAWHCQSVEAVLRAMDSHPHGLALREAAQRLASEGRNCLVEPEAVNPWHLLLGQFKPLLVWILIAAGVLSGLLGEWVDAVAILAIVLLNAAIGFYQEFSAEKSIAALKKMTAPQAKVRRANHLLTLPAGEVVRGDVLELEAGDLVPADARLLNTSSFKVIESALTGESDSVNKSAEPLADADVPLADRTNMIFMGTTVANGVGRAVVVATGMKTEIGRIAALMETADAGAATPLQERLHSFGRALVWAALGVVALMFVLGLMRGMPLLGLVLTAVSLAVAAVPEGLPAIVTIALALGVMRMSRRRALVRKLASVETLGSTNVICNDKTGTLTVGEMTVRELFVADTLFHVTGEGYGPRGEILFEGKGTDLRHAPHLLELGTVLTGCNNAEVALEEGRWALVGDPTEGALLAAGHKAGGSRAHMEMESPRHHEFPFDSDRKRRTVIRRLGDGKFRAFVNGAPDVLLQHCTRIYTADGVRPLTPADRERLHAMNSTMAGRALRVLGSAYRDLGEVRFKDAEAHDIERDLVFVGLAGMQDPPRPEAKQAVARELGIAGAAEGVLTGAELDKLSEDELKHRVLHVAVFARVTAEHKLRIVRAWKAHDAVVAMTGDGVNDAPAIKGADIGIAMGRSGTEVTKQAADLIITDDNFASIVAAVEEGRGIYDNIRKTLQFLLASNIGELSLMTVCVAIGLPMPLLPIHLLWINLVTDGLPALALAADTIDSDVMQRPPRRRGERLADHSFVTSMALFGLLTGGVALLVYLYGLEFETEALARTHAFAALVFAQLFYTFGCRSETKPFWRVSLFSNARLLLVFVLTIALQIFSHHSETMSRFLKTSLMDTGDCVGIFLVSAFPLLVLEGLKVLRRRSQA